MIYAYCSACKTIQKAEEAHKRLFNREGVICQQCRKRLKGQLIQKSCKECKDILYVPVGQAELELPCKVVHEQEKIAARLKEIEEEEKILFSMQQIDCQHCPGVTLRLNHGVYETCPNCHEAPSDAYIAQCWKRLTNQEPSLIEWADPSDGKLIHVDQRTNIPPFSLLLVRPHFYALYTSDGEDWKIYKNGRYPLFKNAYTEEEKYRLANEKKELSLGFGIRIIFFREQAREKKCIISYRFSEGKWKADISAEADLLISRDNVDIFMNRAWDLTDDRELTEAVERKVEETVTDRVFRYLLTQESNDNAVRLFSDRNSVLNWINGKFTLEERRALAEEIEEELLESYGITIPNPIRIKVEVANLHETQRLECYHCGSVQHVPVDAYRRRERFKCTNAACNANILWCKHCNQYVSDWKRENVCDIMGHRIYSGQ